MNALYLTSDQLLAWSVRLDKQVHCRVTRASREAHQAASISAQHSARFSHRALQTLRQSQLPLRAGPWPWPQVLPLRKLPWAAAADGLHAGRHPRADQRLVGRLSTRARDPGRDLRDQPGAPASSRDALSERGEQHRAAHPSSARPPYARSAAILGGGGLLRHSQRQHAHRQYVGWMDRCTGLVLHRRGERS
jgi:hypothetical protein